MLSLSKEALDNSVGVLQRVTNEAFLEHFGTIAKTLKGEADNGGNAVVTQALDNCLKFQNIYNPFVDSMRGLLSDMNAVSEVQEYLEKQANIGAVGSHDATFQNQGIDADSVRI